MSVDHNSVLTFLEAVDADIPKLKVLLTGSNVVQVESFIKSTADNPTLLAIADKFFPGMGKTVALLAPFAGELDKIVPMLDFFQQMLDPFLKVVENLPAQ